MLLVVRVKAVSSNVDEIVVDISIILLILVALGFIPLFLVFTRFRTRRISNDLNSLDKGKAISRKLNKFCNVCGVKIYPDDSFCSNCGSEL